MHPAIIIGTVRSLIVDVAMGQIPRSTERISSISINIILLYGILQITVLFDMCAAFALGALAIFKFDMGAHEDKGTGNSCPSALLAPPMNGEPAN